MTERPWLVIPMRSWSDGKRRLAGCLPAGGRFELNRRFFEHLLAQAAVWPGLDRTLVVSPCKDLLARAAAAGAHGLHEPACTAHADTGDSEGLNTALCLARDALRARQAGHMLVVASDLPMATAQDMRQLYEAACRTDRHAGVALAADRGGQGTNALCLPLDSELAFCFGRDSAPGHVRAAKTLGLPVIQVRLEGLALDIDTPRDLEDWRRLLAAAPS